MKVIMKAFTSRKKGIGSQRGFTLTEILIVLVISAFLLVGSSQMVYHMVVTSATDRHKANALIQVQYVGFWVSEDVMQARPDGVSLGGGQGLPLNITWTEWDGDFNQVVYSVQGYTVGGEQLEKLNRQHLFTPKGGSVMDKGTTVVGEFLDPGGTSCEWVTDAVEGGNVTAVLKLTVAANVDGQVASRTYEINPRSR